MMGTGYLLEMLRHTEKDRAKDEESTKITSNSSMQESTEISETSYQPPAIETTSITVEMENVSHESTDEAIKKNEIPQIRIHYNFESPRLLLQESASFSKDIRCTNNFLKGCKWSPDGSCLLTNSEDRKLKNFTLPSAYYESEFFSGCHSENQENHALNLLSTVGAGDLIYDYCWYPLMNSSNLESCVYACTSRDHPIHLCDAISGILCATYLPINHLDEVCSAYSLAFNPDGSRLYAGFNKTVRVFDTYCPGRQISTKPTWRKRQGGQTGIISCIAVCPTMPTMYACGSYNRTVATYADTFEDGPLSTMQAKGMGGVTHLVFHPNGHYLYSGGRVDSEILCWDVRVPGRIFALYARDAATNQRFYFDLDQSGQHLITGSSKGEIKIWDTSSTPDDAGYAKPTATFQAHSSAANGVSLNPFLPVLATASGQRMVALSSAFSDDENESDSGEDVQSDKTESDNSVKLWLVGNLVSGEK